MKRKHSTLKINLVIPMTCFAVITGLLFLLHPAFAEDLPVDTSLPQPEDSSIVEQTQGDVTIRVTGVKIVHEDILMDEDADPNQLYARIDVCYTTVDDGDWYPVTARDSLQFGEHRINLFEFGFGGEKKADGKSFGERCVKLLYLLEKGIKVEPPIAFTMDKLMAVPREGTLCKNLQHRVETNLRAQEAKIKINCTEPQTESFIGATGSEQATITSYDTKNFTADETQAILDTILSPVVEGPWEFRIDKLD